MCCIFFLSRVKAKKPEFLLKALLCSLYIKFINKTSHHLTVWPQVLVNAPSPQICFSAWCYFSSLSSLQGLSIPCKQESSRKTSISALLTLPKPLNVSITINCGKFWKRWEYQTTWPATWESYIQVRMQQVELDMEQQTGSK